MRFKGNGQALSLLSYSSGADREFCVRKLDSMMLRIGASQRSVRGAMVR
jgi:hypothetical protein